MAAWLAPLQPQLRLCVAGPAETLFRARLGTTIVSYPTLEEALASAQVLISGTGWASDLEHRARRLASQRGIPSIAVLDHWVNYIERFQREGDRQLPDALWVADAEAAALATAVLPSVPVLQLQNLWLKGICTTVQRLRRKKDPRPRKPARRLLYLLEPTRVAWNSHPNRVSEAGEFQSLHYWLRQLPHLIELGWVAPKHELESLALRPHPSEQIGKYDAWITGVTSSWPIQLDRALALEESLAWSDAAFGCETQGLVAAMACGLPAFSTLPPWAPPCRLPHSSLMHIRHLT